MPERWVSEVSQASDLPCTVSTKEALSFSEKGRNGRGERGGVAERVAVGPTSDLSEELGVVGLGSRS